MQVITQLEAQKLLHLTLSNCRFLSMDGLAISLSTKVKSLFPLPKEVILVRIMLVKTNANPRIIEVIHNLYVFQELVGGMIEVVEPFEDDVVIVCNETGRNEGTPVNRVINDQLDICGDFFLCGQNGDELTDFPMEKVSAFDAMLRLPS